MREGSFVEQSGQGAEWSGVRGREERVAEI